MATPPQADYQSLRFVRKVLSTTLIVLLVLNVGGVVVYSLYLAVTVNKGAAILLLFVGSGISMLSYLILKSIPELISVIIDIAGDIRFIRSNVPQLVVEVRDSGERASDHKPGKSSNHEKDPSQMTSKELYGFARDLYINKKDKPKALEMLRLVIERFPNDAVADLAQKGIDKMTR